MNDKKGLALPDLEKRVADQIIALLERDGLAWMKCWATPTPPQNFQTKHVYRGSNVLLTGLSMMAYGWTDPRFLTFKQAIDLGGNVRKGSKGVPILFASTATKTDDATGDERRFAFRKIRHVFNVADVENIAIDALPVYAPEPRTRNAGIDAFVANTGIAVQSATSAFFSSATDAIGIPDIGFFLAGNGLTGEERYYSTLLHELIHATGVPKRLNRQCYVDYHKRQVERAREELVAEIGAVMLGQYLGLQPEPREENAAYVASWISLLKDKPASVFEASSAAGKALAFLEAMQPAAQSQTELEAA